MRGPKDQWEKKMFKGLLMDVCKNCLEKVTIFYANLFPDTVSLIISNTNVKIRIIFNYARM